MIHCLACRLRKINGMRPSRKIFAIFVAAFAPHLTISVAFAQSSDAVQAALSGLFGVGKGFAVGIAATSKPSSSETLQAKSGFSPVVERKTYIHSEIQAVLVGQVGSKNLLPVSVAATTPAAIRLISKELSELTRSGAIPNYGKPVNQSENTMRYLGPAESCTEYLDLRFKFEALESVKWSFCGE